MPYISKQGLSNLSYYKYVGVDKSILANYIMQKFWIWLINYFPLFLAPNLITLLGFFAMISMYVVMYFTVADDGSLPRFVYLFNAICIFFYQTMDALDGKQARRTLSSSALGELFDHGCDAVTTVLIAMVMNTVFRLERDWLFFFCVFMIMLAFYCAQWEYYFTGTLELGYANVTEAQWISITLNMIPFFLGADIYLTHIGPYQLRHILLTPIIGGVLISIVNNILKIKTLLERDPKLLPKAYESVLPGFATATGFAIWAIHSSYLLRENPFSFGATFGMVFAILVGRLVLAKITDTPMPPWLYVMVPLPVCVINSFLGIVEEKYAVFLYLLFAVSCYVHLALGIIEQMTTYLKIKCFIIPVSEDYHNKFYEDVLKALNIEKIIRVTRPVELPSRPGQ